MLSYLHSCPAQGEAHSSVVLLQQSRPDLAQGKTLIYFLSHICTYTKPVRNLSLLAIPPQWRDRHRKRRRSALAIVLDKGLKCFNILRILNTLPLLRYLLLKTVFSQLGKYRNVYKFDT